MVGFVKKERSRIEAHARMEEFRRDCCICSYHVYKEIRQVSIGEELEYMTENGKAHMITTH